MVHGKDLSRTACKEFEQDLVLYYYGECEGEERSRLESHLEGCAACRCFLKDLDDLLPLTIKLDEPPQAFWERYAAELRRKLQGAEQKGPWWSALLALLRPWPVPALATALILILALTLTFAKRFWSPEVPPPVEEAVMEMEPSAENFEFFKAMDFLESMDLLEALEGPGLGNGTV